jgi:uncharacterized membrane protein
MNMKKFARIYASVVLVATLAATVFYALEAVNTSEKVDEVK